MGEQLRNMHAGMETVQKALQQAIESPRPTQLLEVEKTLSEFRLRETTLNKKMTELEAKVLAAIRMDDKRFRQVEHSSTAMRFSSVPHSEPTASVPLTPIPTGDSKDFSMLASLREQCSSIRSALD